MSNISTRKIPNTNAEIIDSRWKSLCKTGAIAALIMFSLIIIQIIIYTIWPPPDTAEGYFSLFQSNWLLGLLSLDLLYIIDSVLLILIYLALYVVLRKAGESSMLIAVVLGIVGVAPTSSFQYRFRDAFPQQSVCNRYNRNPADSTPVSRTSYAGDL